MDIPAKKHKILDSFSGFVATDTDQGGRLVIDVYANVLLCNDKNLPVNFTLGSSAISTLPALKTTLSEPNLKNLVAQNNTTTHQISGSDDGEDYWYQLIISPIYKSENSLFLIEFVNISHYKSVETQANRQVKRIENEILLRTKEVMNTSQILEETGGYLQNFMRGLRHDLKSPVAQLKEIIKYYQNATTSEKKKMAEEHINATLQKLSNTANGLSDFVDLHFFPDSGIKLITLESVCQNAMDSLKNDIALSDAKIRTDFSKAESVRFDEKLLSSTFYNLISNAIKFRDPNKKLSIDITSQTVNETFVLTVKDNGIGMDLDRYGHLLFEPFKKLNMDKPGAGVGLSMLKNMMEKHNSDIEVESTLNEGTTVIVKIPLH